MPAETLTAAGVGLMFALAGLATLRPGDRMIGRLMVVTGVTWWAGWLGDAALFWHRGPLVHLLLLYPGRRLSRPAGCVLGAAYLFAVLAPLNRIDSITVAFSVGVILATGAAYLRARGPLRRGRLSAFLVAVLIFGWLASGAGARLSGQASETAIAWGYDVAIGLGAVVLFLDLRWGRWTQTALTELVVDLGERGVSDSLAERLARTVGDPTLRLAYWLPDRRSYVDESGQEVTLPTPGPDRTVTLLEHDGRRVAAMVHDPALAYDPAIVHAAAAVVALALANVAVQAEVQARVSELEASRRRLVDAADAERRRMSEELERGAQRHLRRVAEYLGERIGEDELVREQLTAAQSALGEFAVGMYPARLADFGLGPALKELLGSYPLPHTVQVETEQLSLRPAEAAYFVCAEALANVVKHAHATHVRIDVTQHEKHLSVKVADDGMGGADLSHGTGIRGLADRVEALGGRVSVDSQPGGGTRLEAWIPTTPPPEEERTTGAATLRNPR